MMEVQALDIQNPERQRAGHQNPRLGELKEAVDQVVGRVFFGTLLAQMRGSSLKGKYGHGGRGEDIFAAQLDGIIAERAGGSLDSGLGQALFDHLARQQHRLTVASDPRVGRPVPSDPRVGQLLRRDQREN